MHKQLILFLLLGHTLLAHAITGEPISLKIETKLGGAEIAPTISIDSDDHSENYSKYSLTSHSVKTSLKLKRSSALPISGIVQDTVKNENSIKHLKHFAWHSENTQPSPLLVASPPKVAAEQSDNLNKIRENAPEQTKQTEWQPSKLTWQIGGQVTLGLVLSYLVLEGVRYSLQAKPPAQLVLGLHPHQTQPGAESLVQRFDPVLLAEEDWEPSTSMEASPAAKQSVELPSYPTNLIQISPVVRPMISIFRNLALPSLPSPQFELVEKVQLPDRVNFFADFTPGKFDNANEFLKSRRAITIEQIIEWSNCEAGSLQFITMAHRFG